MRLCVNFLDYITAICGTRCALLSFLPYYSSLLYVNLLSQMQLRYRRYPEKILTELLLDSIEKVLLRRIQVALGPSGFFQNIDTYKILMHKFLSNPQHLD